jgi:hypothetical protein
MGQNFLELWEGSNSRSDSFPVIQVVDVCQIKILTRKGCLRNIANAFPFFRMRETPPRINPAVSRLVGVVTRPHEGRRFFIVLLIELQHDNGEDHQHGPQNLPEFHDLI